MQEKVQIIIDSKIPTIYEKVDLGAELMNAFSTEVPDNILRVVHLIDLKKESYSRKVNEFVREEKARMFTIKVLTTTHQRGQDTHTIQRITNTY